MRPSVDGRLLPTLEIRSDTFSEPLNARIAASLALCHEDAGRGAISEGLTASRTFLRIEMAKGKVDFFNDTGGYGFITTEDADEDVFFHMEDVGGPDLEEGQEVEFDIEDAPKGPRATNVTRL